MEHTAGIQYCYCYCCASLKWQTWELSVPWQETGILMIVCNMLLMMNRWVRVQTCFWVRDWTAPFANMFLPELGHSSDCGITLLFLSINSLTLCLWVTGIAGLVTMLTGLRVFQAVGCLLLQVTPWLCSETMVILKSTLSTSLSLTFLSLSTACAVSLCSSQT